MLGSAIEWRLKRRDMLSRRTCPSCAADPLSHDARMFGTDTDGDAVFNNCFALHRDYNSSAIANHMACLFERALLHYPAEPSSTELRRWTWCIDMYGFGLQHTDPRTSLELLKLLECAYPERLKRMLIVGAPSVFWVLWRTLKPFVQEKTAAKIEFVAWSDAPQRFEELLGPTVAGRLVSEGVWLQHCDARTRSTARHFYAYALSRTAWHRMAPCFACRSREPQQGERSGEAVVDILRVRSRRVVVSRGRCPASATRVRRRHRAPRLDMAGLASVGLSAPVFLPNEHTHIISAHLVRGPPTVRGSAHMCTEL